MDYYKVLRECYSALLAAHEQLEIEYLAGKTSINEEGWKVICDIDLQAAEAAAIMLRQLEETQSVGDQLAETAAD